MLICGEISKNVMKKKKKRNSTRGVVWGRDSKIRMIAFGKCDFREARISQMRCVFGQVKKKKKKKNRCIHVDLAFVRCEVHPDKTSAQELLSRDGSKLQTLSGENWEKQKSTPNLAKTLNRNCEIHP